MSKFQQSAHPVQCTIMKSAVLKVVDTALCTCTCSYT